MLKPFNLLIKFMALTVLILTNSAFAEYRIHQKITKNGIEVLGVTKLKPIKGIRAQTKSNYRKILRQLPYYIEAPDKKSQLATFREIAVSEDMLEPDLRWQYQMQSQRRNQNLGELKILKLQGPVENRINLTIVGDGYLASESEKFFADAERTLQGLFETATFKSYLPLFNVYAVFTESNTSGIGDGAPKDTAFGLYRTPKGSKRAIFPGNEDAIDAALSAAPATDYPIVIANDEYYGGLGGRYAISTSSKSSGLIVLRHELGHNFGEVGEEYDNGGAYFGANSSLPGQIKWPQWISGKLQTYNNKLLSGDYVWHNLKDSDYISDFVMPNDFSKLFIVLSSVGWSSPQDVLVTLNDQPVKLTGKLHNDRSFHYLGPLNAKAGSEYKLKISQQTPDDDNVLGFAEVFAMPAGYDFTPGKIAAFSTFDDSGKLTYRPTFESCLMRNMETTHFCSVDQENMWLKFLNKIKIVDDLKVFVTAQGFQVDLQTVKLPGLEIKWFQIDSGKEIELTEHRNKFTWQSKSNTNRYRVKVKFRTQEVRLDLSQFDLQKDFTGL
jgi:hypothetical protein